MGYHWHCCGNWTEAEKYYRQALAVDAKLARAKINLGMAIAMQGRIQEAMDEFCEVVSPAEAYANLGFAMLVQKKWRRKRGRPITRRLTLDPSSQRAARALAKLDGTEPGGDRIAGTP